MRADSLRYRVRCGMEQRKDEETKRLKAPAVTSLPPAAGLADGRVVVGGGGGVREGEPPC